MGPREKINKVSHCVLLNKVNLHLKISKVCSQFSFIILITFNNIMYFEVHQNFRTGFLYWCIFCIFELHVVKIAVAILNNKTG